MSSRNETIFNLQKLYQNKFIEKYKNKYNDINKTYNLTTKDIENIKTLVNQPTSNEAGLCTSQLTDNITVILYYMNKNNLETITFYEDCIEVLVESLVECLLQNPATVPDEPDNFSFDEMFVLGDITKIKEYFTNDPEAIDDVSKENMNDLLVNDHTEALYFIQEFKEDGVSPPSIQAIFTAVSKHYFDSVESLMQFSNFEIDYQEDQLMNNAVEFNDIDILKWGEEYDMFPDHESIDLAAEMGFFDILKWAANVKREGEFLRPSESGLDLARENGHTNIVDFFENEESLILGETQSVSDIEFQCD
ncbi:MAG: hypothetical protein JKX76_02165 [Colwellia sp.]|nr:hypothetical protein [Colwellia sp.]